MSKVIPWHKWGSKSGVQNKRPTSVLNAFTNISEKAISSTLLDYTSNYELITTNQHENLQNHSTESAAIINLLRRVLWVYNSLNERKVAIGIFFDYWKAVDHDIWLTKLEYLGVRVSPLKLFTS